jgi:hypothetical protein
MPPTAAGGKAENARVLPELVELVPLHHKEVMEERRGGSPEGQILQTRAESQRIVAEKPLYRLQYPV